MNFFRKGPNKWGAKYSCSNVGGDDRLGISMDMFCRVLVLNIECYSRLYLVGYWGPVPISFSVSFRIDAPIACGSKYITTINCGS